MAFDGDVTVGLPWLLVGLYTDDEVVVALKLTSPLSMV
jgi:hypothetical protein